MRARIAAVVFAVASLARAEYRGFWVDAFNSALNNHADVVAVVSNAKSANANTLLVQVRRRGDAWYLRSLEPQPDFIPIAAGFDPLADLIAVAHEEHIEVHAFVIIGAIWNKNPTFEPSATLGPPTSARHAFNLHGGYDPISKTIVDGPDNWLTRTLLPDEGAISFQGHRFGNDFWVDLGHPAAAAYTFNVLMELVRNYAIDGLHLDRIRYPELSVSGQTPATGTNIGYNPTSVERFQRRYGIAAGSPPPAPNDPRWSQWRRDQVTNFVRRVYLNAVAMRPELKMSAALIAFGGGPTSESSWTAAEAYWRVYQDWRAWTEEGILDLAIPMVYKAEHNATTAAQFDQWLDWLQWHQYNRAGIIGIGGFVNGIEGTLRQTRRAQAAPIAGVTFYSMATSNIAVQTTPQRNFAEFASALTTGKSVDGTTLYQPADATPLFAQTAIIPPMPWKSSPTRGHLMGFARRPDGSPLDSATVTIRETVSSRTVTTIADGDGFFGAVDLEPGRYLIKFELGSETFLSPLVSVVAGAVTRTDVGPRRRVVH
ncbi:MAG TPA: family 10 glycosylhydrolase [Thermoanaerobaculia bacterium]|nr:family 10 glycosylhydrolase [Thermoanaerobaculia bacterium]